MAQSISYSNLFQQAQDETTRLLASVFISIAKQISLTYWPWIAGFLTLVFAGVIVQIIMLRGGGHSKLSPWFNRLAGSVFYGIFFSLELAISYFIWGYGVFDEIWFAVFGLISFPVTKLFLLKIGFWYY